MPKNAKSDVNWQILNQHRLTQKAAKLGNIPYQPLPPVYTGISKYEKRALEAMSNFAARNLESPYRPIQDISYDVARAKHIPAVMNEINAITKSPFGPENAHEYEEYKKVYKKMGQAALDEMVENYHKNIKPQTNYQLMTSGMGRSSVAQSHSDAVLQKALVEMARHNVGLKGQALDAYINQFNKEQARKMLGVELKHGAISKADEQSLQAAEQLRAMNDKNINTKTQQLGIGKDVADFINKRQENQRLEQAQEQIRRQAYPLERLQTEASIAQGIKIDPYQPGAFSMQMPQAPQQVGGDSASNLITTIGAGLLSAQHKRRGGLVSSKKLGKAQISASVIKEINSAINKILDKRGLYAR